MAMILDAFLSDLSKTVIYATQTTANFKPQLKLLTATLQRIKPIIDDMVNLNRKLDRSKQECLMFLDEIQNAQKLVVRCSKIKWDCIKMFLYSRKLENFNDKLLRFFQIEVQAIQIRNIAQILVMENDMNVKVDNISRNLSDMMKQRNGTVGNHGGEREKYGWHVPRLPSGIVAFGEPLEKLKAAVGGGCDDYSVVVVAAPGGCGKTTLVKMLCHDAKIQESFGENVFFVTVSETPNLMVIASDLFDPNSSRPRTLFQSNEDAKNKLENFFNQKASHPMLLVLDDVWSESVIEEIVPLKIKGHKILVTSRIAFPSPKYKAFRCDHLNEEDAKTLFCGSAFTEGWSRPTPTINDNLVNQMVKYSKGHPLTLCVLGRSLNGKDELAWKSMLGKLSQGRSILDLHKDVLIGLERSFEALDDELKQCFLDFGLFPEHQRIPIKTLLNMWMHLYDHDDDGVHTMATILELSYKNLVDLNTTIGNDSGTRIIYCDQQFVTQHDLMRELAIYLNSKLPFEHRTRVAINARGEDLPVSIENVQEPMQARILSISTGELFSSQWCNMEVPDLEVLILNLMSKTYTLPLFLAGLQKLKILNITNHGLYPTQFNNFHFLSSSHNLTRIRLEHVEVSPSILSLVNVQKVSFIMCKFGNPFKKLILNDANFWPQLVEIEIDYHLNVVDFPRTVCYNFQPKKNSITNDIMRLGKIGDFDKLLETLTPHMATPHMHALLKRLRVLLWKLELCNFSSISQLPKDGMLQFPAQEE